MIPPAQEAYLADSHAMPFLESYITRILAVAAVSNSRNFQVLELAILPPRKICEIPREI